MVGAVAAGRSKRYRWNLQLGIVALVFVSTLGCVGPGRTDGTDRPAGTGGPTAIKTITIGALDGVKSYGSFEYPGGGLASLTEIASNAKSPGSKQAVALSRYAPRGSRG